MLIQCPECLKECSDTIKTCPHCGYKIKGKKAVSSEKPQKTFMKNERVRKILLIALSILVILLGGGFVLYNSFVPNYIGDNKESVIQELEEEGIEYKIEYNDVMEYDSDVVYDQSKKIISFSREPLIIYICQNRLYEMPDIIGKKYDEIQNEEYITSFKIEQIYVDDTDIPIGTILSASKGVGEIYKEGEVIIEICAGHYTYIASLEKDNLNDVKKELSDLGITNLDIKYEFSSSVNKDCIISVKPVKIGDLNEKVTLTVSKGPSMNVWDYIGLDEEYALEYAEQNGFTDVICNYSYTGNVECDIKETEYVVVAQNIKGEVAPTDTIKLTLSKPAIKVTDIDMHINSAGGVDTYITFTNSSDKQIAYVYFVVGYYDKMGNPAQCEIRDTALRNLYYTGPLNPNATAYRIIWDAALYNYSVAAICIDEIKVEFSDGTTQTIENTGRYWYYSGYYGGDLHYIN